MSKVIKGSTAPPFPSQKPPAGSGAPIRRAPLGPPSSIPGARKPIIEKEIVEAQSEARRMLAEAEEQATRILDEANAQAEDLRQKGYDAGYQEGLGQYTEQTTRALLEIERIKATVEPEYIHLVRACVEKVLGHEIKSSPDTIVGIVRTALRDATQQREIVVRVNPEDAEHLRKNQRRLLDVLARASVVEVREDPLIARGGCIVLTELGTIDASLERQLAAIEAALDEELKSGGGEAAGAGEEAEAPADEESYEDEEG